MWQKVWMQEGGKNGGQCDLNLYNLPHSFFRIAVILKTHINDFVFCLLTNKLRKIKDLTVFPEPRTAHGRWLVLISNC